ncbi:MAG: methyltransferase domain-containing protein [Alphaproteobacteria bacterium]|nr:methyltransferase domain-containing protein [Alphaproteobacteria bacterium]
MSILRKFFKWQYALSMKFDRAFLDKTYTIYGTTDFHVSLIPDFVPAGAVVYDIGGGKCPHIFPALKEERKIRSIGVDIDEQELARAPQGGYDQTICADITKTTGPGYGDIVISRAVLEHVKDAKAALFNMAGFLKPGGLIIAYAPCRNAWFARLNMILPEGLKKRLINYFYTDAGLAEVMGFKAYYSHGTPAGIEAIAREAGLRIVEKRLYYMSNYFAFFTPFHVFWRLYQITMRALGTEQFCEGFAYVFEKSVTGDV